MDGAIKGLTRPCAYCVGLLFHMRQIIATLADVNIKRPPNCEIVRWPRIELASLAKEVGGTGFEPA